MASTRSSCPTTAAASSTARYQASWHSPKWSRRSPGAVRSCSTAGYAPVATSSSLWPRGASAVLVGRVTMWGLAVDGADGVAQVLTVLAGELAETLLLT